MTAKHPPSILDTADIPQVAVESMNETHREEVELINRLGVLLRADPLDPEAVSVALDAWVEHTREHFAAENRLMQTHGFPAYPMHGAEHQRVLALLESLRQGWQDHHDPAPLVAFLFDQWPGWFDQHVNSMDRVTAGFVSRFL